MILMVLMLLMMLLLMTTMMMMIKKKKKQKRRITTIVTAKAATKYSAQEQKYCKISKHVIYCGDVNKPCMASLPNATVHDH